MMFLIMQFWSLLLLTLRPSFLWQHTLLECFQSLYFSECGRSNFAPKQNKVNYSFVCFGSAAEGETVVCSEQFADVIHIIYRNTRACGQQFSIVGK
jgi:hypothetical protein